MNDLLPQLELFISKRSLFDDGQPILVAVSGGLDSMVLLHTLKKLSTRHRWKISVAHFNHRLRGRASDADEKLVRRTAASMKLPVIVEGADVKAFAQKSRLSIEMAARKLRHEFFARVARERKIATVALAHHADDQVELFFIRLLRGAGVEGLAGMKWRSPSAADRSLSLVRPLLGVPKGDLAEFARKNRIRFRDDATNFSDDFLRNRIRNELLPLLKKKYQPALATVVLRLMEILVAESEFADNITHCLGHEVLAIADPSRHPHRTVMRRALAVFNAVGGVHFENWPAAIQRRVLQAGLSEAGIAPDFDLVESLRRSPNTPVSVGPNFSVARDTAGKIRLQTTARVQFDAGRLAVDLGVTANAVFNGTKLRWEFLKGSKTFKFQISNLKSQIARECFDADRVGAKVVLRHWRAGDRFRPIGMTSAKKLQDLFTDAKIPRERRHRLVVATTAAGEIFWVEGLRMAEEFKVTGRTKRRLVWKWRSVS